MDTFATSWAFHISLDHLLSFSPVLLLGPHTRHLRKRPLYDSSRIHVPQYRWLCIFICNLIIVQSVLLSLRLMPLVC